MTNITITAPEEFHNTLKEVLPLYKIETPLNHISQEGNTVSCDYNGEIKSFKLPVRLGRILDFLINATDTQKTPKTIEFATSTLNTHNLIFTTEKGKKINLTEKEAELLIHLYKNKGSIVSREDLLRAVWNYSKDVETHTLETHIYRLRKKIEKNPSSPNILITADNGYTVN